MFIKKNKIPSVVKQRMKKTAGWRENNIMKMLNIFIHQKKEDAFIL